MWGLPEWGGYTGDEALTAANKWAKEKFGFTIRLQSRSGGVSAVQGLNLLMAQDQFPDIIILDSLGSEVKAMIQGLTEQGKILPLDKYFDDPEYDQLVQADMEYMNQYVYDGKIRCIPGNNWKVREDDPAWAEPLWTVRVDIGDAEGGYFSLPKNTDDLYELLKDIKGQYKDMDDQAVFPFAITPDPDLRYLTEIIKQMNGAGWQVDKSMNYGPFWASSEVYESIKDLNKFWQEGLMYPGQFQMDKAKHEENLAKVRYGIVAGSESSTYPNVKQLMDMVKKNGYDDPEAAKLRSMKLVLMQNPIQEENGKIGTFFNREATPVLISADCPNPDGVMKWINWLVSEEGIVTIYTYIGFLGEDWIWEAPKVWKRLNVPEGQEYTKYEPDLIGSYCKAEDNTEDFPTVIPFSRYITYPSKSWYTPWVNRKLDQQHQADYGIHRGSIQAGEWNDAAHVNDFSVIIKPLVTPKPSYLLFYPDLNPLEESAMLTVEQRWREGLPKVITADDFDAAYSEFIETMLNVTNWKPVYSKLETQWKNWMKDNVDDRSELRTISWRPEFTEVMDW